MTSISSITFTGNECAQAAIGSGFYNCCGDLFNPLPTPFRGLYFDGDENYEILLDVVVETRFSLVTWVYRKGPGLIAGFAEIEGKQMSIYFEAPTIKVTWNDDTREVPDDPGMLNHRWRMVSFSFKNAESETNSNDFSVYLDNQVVHTETDWNAMASSFYGTGTTYFGGGGSDFTMQNFQGFIWHISIYNGPLTTTDVATIFDLDICAECISCSLPNTYVGPDDSCGLCD